MIEDERIYDLIIREYERFPKAEIQDYYKLLFQSVFGARHMVKTYDGCLGDINEEMYVIEAMNSIPIYYDIGLDIPIVRVNLARCKAEEIPGETIASAFFNGSRIYRNKYSSNFEFLLKSMCNSLAKPPFQIKRDKLTDFYTRVRELGFPPIHHSRRYRKLYKPHYRVIPLDAWEDTIKKWKG